MYGAILGDIIGSPYEFDSHNIKTKEFELFSDRSEFTDDSIMTLAVGEALMDAGRDASDEEIKEALVRSMQKYGQAYPLAGFGMNFSVWLNQKDPKPYNSYGNESAVRVSAVPWLYQEDFEKTLHVARLTAEVTHNHPEGIKGAEATAAAIFMAIHGQTGDQIRNYIVKHYGYDLSRTCDQIRPDYHHVESCQETVPEAMTAFLEGKDFEDVIRTAVSLGGDSDTLTAIAGSMAEAFYGVPEELKRSARAALPSDLLAVLVRFDEYIEQDRKDREADPARKAAWDNMFKPAAKTAAKPGRPAPDQLKAVGNEPIEEAIGLWKKDNSKENAYKVMEAIRIRMNQGGRLLVPVAVNPGKNMRVGGNKMNLQAIRTKDGKLWQPAYTSEDQLKKTGARKISVLTFPIENLFKRMLEQKDSPDKIAASISGIVLNLQDKSMFLPLGAIDAILKANEEVKKKQAGASRIVFAKGDITQFKADAIVNAANESLRPGGGVCGAIHAAAGPELAEACAKLGGCRTGEAVITDAYNLPHKKVIHAVGPVYHGTDEDRTLLAEAYRNSLNLARDNKLKSVVFPAISTGIFGYPKEEAAKIAFGACAQWIRENQSYGMTVIMCAYDQETFDIYQKFIPKKKS